MRWINIIGDIMNIISNKKLEANRKNALKSTGPKTKEGKLSAEELQKQMEKESALQKEKETKAYEKKQSLQKEKERIKRNEEAFARERRYIYFCNPYEPINKNRLGHSKIIKKKKNYNYY